MKQQNVIPNEGQFLVTWDHDGVPWCATARVKNGTLQRYSSASDCWKEYNVPSDVDLAYFSLETPKAEKPPLGLMPEKEHKRARSIAICQAMERYAEACKPIPSEWADELQRLCRAA